MFIGTLNSVEISFNFQCEILFQLETSSVEISAHQGQQPLLELQEDQVEALDQEQIFKLDLEKYNTRIFPTNCSSPAPLTCLWVSSRCFMRTATTTLTRTNWASSTNTTKNSGAKYFELQSLILKYYL